MSIRLNNARLSGRITEDADFGKKIIFSYEAHFDLGGYVNKQNCHICGTENRHAYIENPLFSADFGPITVNGDRYRAMLNEFLFTKIEDQDIGNIWFQQDGATCHAAETTIDVLRRVFEDRIISPRVDIVWPPRNCDLTPLDYYLWSAVKDKCYADKPETIDA